MVVTTHARKCCEGAFVLGFSPLALSAPLPICPFCCGEKGSLLVFGDVVLTSSIAFFYLRGEGE